MTVSITTFPTAALLGNGEPLPIPSSSRHEMPFTSGIGPRGRQADDENAAWRHATVSGFRAGQSFVVERDRAAVPKRRWRACR